MKGLAERLKFSREEAERLKQWSLTAPLTAKTSERELAKRLYRGNRQGIADVLKLSLARARGRAADDDNALVEAGGFSRLLTFAGKWQKPEFPLRGGDLAELGAVEGPDLGALLKELENEWIESGFEMSRGALMKRAADRLSD